MKHVGNGSCIHKNMPDKPGMHFDVQSPKSTVALVPEAFGPNHSERPRPRRLNVSRKANHSGRDSGPQAHQETKRPQGNYRETTMQGTTREDSGPPAEPGRPPEDHDETTKRPHDRQTKVFRPTCWHFMTNFLAHTQAGYVTSFPLSRRLFFRATPWGCCRRPWPWLCLGAEGSAADPASWEARAGGGIREGGEGRACFPSGGLGWSP